LCKESYELHEAIPAGDAKSSRNSDSFLSRVRSHPKSNMRPFHDFGAAWKCSFFTVNHFGISVVSTIQNSERGSALFFMVNQCEECGQATLRSVGM
jgi:hypothetical protein